jgi:kynureninase
VRPADLYASPNALAHAYSRFRVGERLLLTGHSHQAWPDRSLEGQLRAWMDAAEAVDAKWERAFEMAERVRRGFARMLDDERDDDCGDYVLGANTHELVVRFLSALPLGRRPRLLTTDGEFHTLRRQLDRLAEEGIEVVKVPARPAAEIAERLAGAVDDRTAAVLVSAVLFGSGALVPGLDRVAAACARVGAELLVDAYHAANVVPFPLARLGLGRAFAVGGGYKYCQMGEGNCFLRVPEGTDLRPVVTGWYAEFEALSAPPGGGVGYGSGAARWAGATYDPTSHYRAAAVLDFFAEQGMTVGFLREVSQHQVGLLIDRFDALDLPESLLARDRDRSLAATGGFLALTSPRAGEICRRLAARGVATDHRGDVLRLGPAPYLSDGQLRAAMGILGEVAREAS